MEFSNVERTLPPRPQAQGANLLAPGKMSPSPALPEGVVNDINPQVQAMAERTHTDQAPPNELEPAGLPASLRPAVQHEPLSKLLMAHLQSVWTASARVIDQARLTGNDKNLLHQQEVVHARTQHRNFAPSEVPGTLARSSLIYTPSKVNKIDAA